MLHLPPSTGALLSQSESTSTSSCTQIELLAVGGCDPLPCEPSHAGLVHVAKRCVPPSQAAPAKRSKAGDAEAAPVGSPSSTGTDSQVYLGDATGMPERHAPAANDCGFSSGHTLDPSAGSVDGLRTMLRVMSVASTRDVPTSPPATPTGPKGMYMDDNLRREAVSWLVEQVVQLGLRQETLFLAVALFDRFVAASEAIPANYVPLIGSTCMYIAAKMEGDQVHPASAYARIVDNTLKADAIIKMETHVLDTLEWRSMHTTAWSFLGMLHARLQLPPAAKAMADLLIELSLLEAPFISCAPLAIAAGAIILAARTTLRARPQAQTTLLAALQQLLGCSLERLTTVVNALETLYTMTLCCSIEHPAYPIHQKHCALQGGACAGTW